MPDPIKNLKDQRRFSNAIRQLHIKNADDLTDDLLSEKISLQTWQKEMKNLIREAHVQQFITGKGGVRTDVLAGDYGVLGTVMREQYQYLQGFADSIAKAQSEGKSLDFIANRAGLYMKASQSSFWVSAVGEKLPQVPRDGKTACRSNCKCYLDIEEDDGEMLIYWKLKPAEHCDDCKQLAREWNPKRVKRTAKASASFTPRQRINQGRKLFVLLHSEEPDFEKEVLEIMELIPWNPTKK